MNRVLFNEGGQPIYLDDLKQLQDNDIDFNRLLLETIGGKDKALLLARVSDTPNSYDRQSGMFTFVIPAGTIITEGLFIEFPETEVRTHGLNNPIYVCIKDVQTDEREHQDGQLRPCRQSKQAYISVDKTGAQSAYNIFELPTLKDAFREFVGVTDIDSRWIPVNVLFSNGYSGKVQYQILKYSIRVKIDISSTKSEWEHNFEGLLFELDEAGAQIIERGWSGLFGCGGEDNPRPCALLFSDRKCHLEPLDGEEFKDPVIDTPMNCSVKHIYDIPV